MQLLSPLEKNMNISQKQKTLSPRDFRAMFGITVNYRDPAQKQLVKVICHLQDALGVFSQNVFTNHWIVLKKQGGAS